jgi:hypothetical protein
MSLVSVIKCHSKNTSVIRIMELSKTLFARPSQFSYKCIFMYIHHFDSRDKILNLQLCSHNRFSSHSLVVISSL